MQKRLNISAERMCIPDIPEELFMEGLTELLKLDSAWVPSNSLTVLYILGLSFSELMNT